MDKSRLEIKVGLFVFIGLALLAVLLIQFSKGTSLFRGTYELRLHAVNVGGLKQRAGVLLAGVQVGSVSDIQLADDGKSVTILLESTRIIKFITTRVLSSSNPAFSATNMFPSFRRRTRCRCWKNSADVKCQEPFNLQEVARSASGFIQRIDETAKKLDESVSDLQRVVLNGQTLTNFAVAIDNCARSPSRRWERS